MKCLLTVVALLFCLQHSLHASVASGADSVFFDMYLSAKKSGDIHAAMEYASIFLKSSDTVTMRTAPLAEELSEYMEENFKFSEALRWRKALLELYAKAGADIAPGTRAGNEYRLAKLFYRTGEYHLAFEHATRAKEVFQASGDEKSYLDCINLLGAVYYVCKDFDNSNYYFRLFAEGAERINDSSLLVMALNNIAVYTNTVSDSTKTRSLISRCIDLCKAMNDTSWLCKMYINISASYINGNDLRQAERYLSLARPLLGDIEEYGQYYHYLGVIQYLSGDARGAIGSLNEAIGYYGEGEFADRQQFCLELLQELYASEGDWEDAYGALFRWYVTSKGDKGKDAVVELFRARAELIEQSKREEEMAHEKKRTVALAVGLSALALVGAGIFMAFKRREYDIRRREEEVAAKNEIAEFKRMQQYKTDMLVEETIGGLNRLGSDTDDPQLKSELSRICNVLRDTKEHDEWKEMKAFVPRFNSDFYKNLITQYPALTINERRLCVFLNMNLTTKEISDITRQSVQSINTARGRLRKKLGITGDNISIQEFLSKFN